MTVRMTGSEFIEAIKKESEPDVPHVYNVDVYDATISDLCLENICIKATRFYNTVFQNCSFSYSHLGSIDFHNCGFEHCNFVDENLSYIEANFYGCYLFYCKFTGIDFLHTCMYDTTIYRCNFQNVYFYEAMLARVFFSFSSLDNANFECSTLIGNSYNDDFSGVNFNITKCNVCLTKCDNCNPPKNFPVSLQCPSEGEFVGWKKCYGNKIVKLLIPADAKRVSSFSNKCRCDKAFVLEIQDIEGNSLECKEAFSCCGYGGDSAFTYTVGEWAYPDSFNENRWEECSHGIHFFIDRAAAVAF